MDVTTTSSNCAIFMLDRIVGTPNNDESLLTWLPVCDVRVERVAASGRKGSGNHSTRLEILRKLIYGRYGESINQRPQWSFLPAFTY